jgi:preprotein translocase subunit Sec61beta
LCCLVWLALIIFFFFVVIVCLVMAVLFFIACVYLLVYFQHEEDKNTAWIPKVILLVGMWLSMVNILVTTFLFCCFFVLQFNLCHCVLNFILNHFLNIDVTIGCFKCCSKWNCSNGHSLVGCVFVFVCFEIYELLTTLF